MQQKSNCERPNETRGNKQTMNENQSETTGEISSDNKYP